MYRPLNYENININNSQYSPTTVKYANNPTFDYWCRSLFQRACSVIEFNLPENWSGSVKDFFYYCLFQFGYVVVFDNKKYGLTFQPCNLSGYDLYYQPVKAIVSNPGIKLDQSRFTLGKDAELIKLTPDYMGIFDIIYYYAKQLAELTADIDMSLINDKVGLIIGARSKSAGKILKAALDEINKGNPAVIFDKKYITNDLEPKEDPFYIFDRKVKENYILTSQLTDFNTIINNFDCEVGIPTIPFNKRERLITSEVESRVIDSTSRSTIWIETLKSSIERVNRMFSTEISCELRYNIEKEGEENVGETDINRTL